MVSHKPDGRRMHTEVPNPLRLGAVERCAHAKAVDLESDEVPSIEREVGSERQPFDLVRLRAVYRDDRRTVLALDPEFETNVRVTQESDGYSPASTDRRLLGSPDTHFQ